MLVFTQSISPGLTRTEFYGRMNKLEDIEKSKQEYDKFCKDVSAYRAGSDECTFLILSGVLIFCTATGTWRHSQGRCSCIVRSIKGWGQYSKFTMVQDLCTICNIEIVKFYYLSVCRCLEPHNSVGCQIQDCWKLSLCILSHFTNFLIYVVYFFFCADSWTDLPICTSRALNNVVSFCWNEVLILWYLQANVHDS